MELFVSDNVRSFVVNHIGREDDAVRVSIRFETGR
jgi:hypothetical protein